MAMVPVSSGRSQKEKTPEGIINVNHSSTKNVSAIPTAKEYALEGAIETTEFVKEVLGVAGSIFPGAQEILKLAIALMRTCQVCLFLRLVSHAVQR